MPRWRLGVALLVPELFATEINGLRRALGDGSFDRIPPHITLVPPVNVRVDEVADAMRVLRNAAGPMRPFEVDLGPVSTFHPDTPTITLAVEGSGLAEVRALRDAVFTPPLERTLTWPFVPHVTLSDDAEDERIAASVAALSEYAATVTFDRVHLMREESGRQWVPLADIPFGPPTILGRGGRELTVFESKLIDPIAAQLFDGEVAMPRTDLAITIHEAGEPVGVVGGSLDGSVMNLTALVVRESERGQGFGGHLITAFCAASARMSVQNVVASEVGDLANFLMHVGFAPRGRSRELERAL